MPFIVSAPFVARSRFPGLCAAALALGLSAAAPSAHAQTETARLGPSDPAANDNFGYSVSVSGNLAIVGAWHEGPPTNAGAAYVFEQTSPGVWTQDAKLTAFDRALNDNYGISVAISNDVAVIGTWQDSDGGISSGSAYVYRRVGGIWTPEGKLLASDRANLDHFGLSVAIDGNVIAVGADQASTPSTADGGAVYVFRYNGLGWAQEAKLTAADAANGDSFSESLSISGNSIIAGSRQDDDAGSASGSAYVFNYNGVAWSQQAKITAPDAAANDQFGKSVSISGDTAAIGASLNDDGGSNTGSAYVYHRAGSVWTLQAKLLASDAFAGDNFGNSVAVDGDDLVVGSFLAAGQTGTYYLYTRTGVAWSETDRFGGGAFFGSDSNSLDQFAFSIALNGGNILVGGPGNDSFGAQSGAAYVFNITPPASADSDGDGLSDADELALGTDPFNSDTDADGLDDGTEVALAAGGPCPSPLNADSDGDGLSDGNETGRGSNPCNADSDGDGLSDGAEAALAGAGTCPNLLTADSDNDGLSDGAEANAGLNPCVADTDGDGLSDALEIAFGTNGNNPDTDADGLSDGAEVALAAGSGCPNPLVADSDGDGLSDGSEHAAGLSPCNADTDGDGLSDSSELARGTNPLDSDTDNDGLLDGAEVSIAGSGSCPSPLDPDSDNDGIDDGNELTAGLAPCDNDSDNDGLSDGNEALYGTDPHDADTDNDGVLDGVEVDIAMGTGCPSPLDPDSDNDGLSDGVETATLHTNPCSADTDGDGLPDATDPQPTVPAISPCVISGWINTLACNILNTDQSLFLGPNVAARKARRLEMALLVGTAAQLVHCGHYNAAIALLQTVEKRTDGASPPPDWMTASPTRNAFNDDLNNFIDLLDLIN